jgi:homoserine dehydrogenase
MSKQLTIGLFGFGCVGQGLYDVLKNSKQFTADFKKICIKDPNKKRILDEKLFTTDKWELLNDEQINTIVELIDDPEEAYQIIITALKKGKNVVTANKKVVAEHLEELVLLQKEYNCSLIYEASACGGIPIIRTLEEYYDNEELKSISGIFNGSSNFILTKIYLDGLTYNEALTQAQELGFAETDPILDVEGFDPKYKLIILALHAFGAILKPERVFNSGISNIGETELKLYKETKIAIKLNPVLEHTQEGDLVAYVLPQLILPSNKLYNINNEYNAVVVEGLFSNEQLFIGKGAGGHPTGSAVLSDISALSYQYKYSYKKFFQGSQPYQNNLVKLPLYVSGKKTSLEFLFPGSEIVDIEGKATVITERSIDWLIQNQSILNSEKIFVARIHDDAKYALIDWQNQFKHQEVFA